MLEVELWPLVPTGGTSSSKRLGMLVSELHLLKNLWRVLYHHRDLACRRIESGDGITCDVVVQLCFSRSLLALGTCTVMYTVALEILMGR